MEDLRTTEQVELDTIIDGLDSQAQELEDEARDIAKQANAFGIMAVLAVGAALGTEYVPEQLPYEKTAAVVTFVLLGGGAVVHGIREQLHLVKARRKRRLADRLEDEAEELDSLPVY